MQPAAPTSAAMNKRTAKVGLSSWESNPLARQPPARKAALRQAHKAIRRYFRSAFPLAAGDTSTSAGKCSCVSAGPGLFVRCAFPFFVVFASVATLGSVVPNCSGSLPRNLARPHHLFITIEAMKMPREPGFPGIRWLPGC
jgi:hypothetical protein